MYDSDSTFQMLQPYIDQASSFIQDVLAQLPALTKAFKDTFEMAGTSKLSYSYCVFTKLTRRSGISTRTWAILLDGNGRFDPLDWYFQPHILMGLDQNLWIEGCGKGWRSLGDWTTRCESRSWICKLHPTFLEGRSWRIDDNPKLTSSTCHHPIRIRFYHTLQATIVNFD